MHSGHRENTQTAKDDLLIAVISISENLTYFKSKVR